MPQFFCPSAPLAAPGAPLLGVSAPLARPCRDAGGPALHTVMIFASTFAGGNLPPKAMADRSVRLKPFCVDPLERREFEAQAAAEMRLGKKRAALLVRRRDDISMYGKLYANYPPGTPDYMLLSVSDVYDGEVLASDEQPWDATMVQRPAGRPEMQPGVHMHVFAAQPSPWSLTPDPDLYPSPGEPAFLAMNRFVVKPDEASRRLFEQRWATRESKLAGQPGFVGFSLLRRASPPAAGQAGTPRTPIGHPSDTPRTPDVRGPAPLMNTSAPLLCTTQRSRQTRAPPDSAALASSAVCSRHTRDSFSRRAASLMRPPPYGRARRRGRRGGRAAARMRTPLRARAAALRSGRVWRTRPSSQQPGIMHVADSSTGVRSGEGGRREEREDRNSGRCN